nr:MAG TPA: hypothetical protein [Caudoviricetes sp.]
MSIFAPYGLFFICKLFLLLSRIYQNMDSLWAPYKSPSIFFNYIGRKSFTDCSKYA